MSPDRAARSAVGRSCLRRSRGQMRSAEPGHAKAHRKVIAFLRKFVCLCLVLLAALVLLVCSCNCVRELSSGRFSENVGLAPLHVAGPLAAGIAVHPEAIHFEVAYRATKGEEQPGWIHHRRTIFSFGSSSLGAWRHHWVRLPSVLILFVLLAYPMWRWFNGPYQRRCRRKLGLCLNCKYDLKGNTSGVCPECGTPVDTGCMP